MFLNFTQSLELANPSSKFAVLYLFSFATKKLFLLLPHPCFIWCHLVPLAHSPLHRWHCRRLRLSRWPVRSSGSSGAAHCSCRCYCHRPHSRHHCSHHHHHYHFHHHQLGPFHLIVVHLCGLGQLPVSSRGGLREMRSTRQQYCKRCKKPKHHKKYFPRFHLLSRTGDSVGRIVGLLPFLGHLGGPGKDFVPPNHPCWGDLVTCDSSSQRQGPQRQRPQLWRL